MALRLSDDHVVTARTCDLDGPIRLGAINWRSWGAFLRTIAGLVRANDGTSGW